MNKYLCFSIIFLLVIFVLFISYNWGLFRYASIKTFPPDQYINQYSKKTPASCKINLSLAANKSNFSSLPETLLSLLDQTVKVNKITIAVPIEDKKSVPDTVKKIATILPTGKNYGKNNKTLPALLAEKDADTVILCLDSGIIYGYDFVETMINESSLNPESCITTTCGSALLTKPKFYDNTADSLTENTREICSKLDLRTEELLKTVVYDKNYKL